MSPYARRTDATRSKFGSQFTEVDGIKFSSKKEAKRYGELKLLERAGHIRALALQVPLPLNVANGRRVGKYVADFTYEERGIGKPPAWNQVVEDVKGFKTQLYKWKKKHVEAQYGITIREV